MKKQTEYRSGIIKRSGCYLCVMLFFVEQVLRNKLSDDDVAYAFEEGQKRMNWNQTSAAVLKDCTLVDPPVVANLILERYGSAKKIVQIGGEKDGVSRFWGGYGKEYDFVAEKWKTPTYYHWITEKYNPDPQVDCLFRVEKLFYKVI